MNSAIELHDSCLNAIEQDGATMRVLIDAYIHRSEGVPGLDAGTGWSQSALIELGLATMQGAIPHLPARLTGGSSRLDGVVHRNSFPLPVAAQESVVLHFVFAEGDRLIIEASTIELTLLGIAQFVENVPSFR